MRASETVRGRITANTWHGGPTMTQRNLPSCPILGPAWGQNEPKCAQNGHKIDPKWPKMANFGMDRNRPESRKSESLRVSEVIQDRSGTNCVQHAAWEAHSYSAESPKLPSAWPTRGLNWAQIGKHWPNGANIDKKMIRSQDSAILRVSG